MLTVSKQPIRVMCVDDNRLVAEAVERRVAIDDRFTWVGWAANTEDLLSKALEGQPDVLLLDIDMPGRDPFVAVRELAEHCPNTRVVMFSGYVRRDYIDRSLEAGAWGYVSKNADIDEVLGAIQTVAEGGFALTPEAMVELSRGPDAMPA